MKVEEALMQTLITFRHFGSVIVSKRARSMGSASAQLEMSTMPFRQARKRAYASGWAWYRLVPRWSPLCVATLVTVAWLVGLLTTAVGQTCPCSIWNTATQPQRIEQDPEPIEVGVRFRADVAGSITGLRFYKGAQNTGTHVGHLWTNTGMLLATVTFSNESASGWQQVSLVTPVAIADNTTYVASYHTDVGYYAVTEPGFTTGVVNPPLRALADGADGGNGVYRYGASGFPTDTYNASNYWVDVVFTTSAPPPPPPPPPSSGVPILIITAASNPLSLYYAEILRTEGLN